MNIKLKELHIENFKGCKDRTIQFGDATKIIGANATGKSTVADSFTWLLFDRDSAGNNKFQIRPLDTDGNPIHNVEIKVAAILDVDGKEVELSKVQKEKWVKRRGSDTKELQGNVNEYSINSYPKSEKEYKAYIASLVDEELFKLITNPSAFSSMPWKKQRDVLMKLVSDVSDAELAREMDKSGKYDALIPELEQASPDDIKAKYTKAMNTWKKKQVEIPARIDEASKQLVDIDVAELEIQKSVLVEDIAEAETAVEDGEAAYSDFQKRSDEVIALKREVADYHRAAMDKASDERRKIQSQIDGYTASIRVSDSNIKNSQDEIDRRNKTIDWCASDRLDLQKQYKEKKAEKYTERCEPLPNLSEDDLVCPTCGQPLPEEMKRERIASYEERCAKYKAESEALKAQFEKSKQAKLADIEAQGKAKVKQIEENKSIIAKLEKSIEDDEKQIAEDRDKKASLEMQLAMLPAEPDLSDDQVFSEMQTRLAKMEEALGETDSGVKQRQTLKIRLSGLREELSAIEKKIASADDSAIEERIEELKSEQRIVGQKVADQERMICLLEDFIRAKMDKVSEQINSKFNTVSWKLFNLQINGGISETCECTVNGVPYSSLNNGHQIIAGLDIIRTLGELYDAQVPIFIDNAEALNDFNIPEMDNQMILLKVSDDKELKVEVC